MSHQDFVRTAGQYPPELAIGANDYQRLDLGQWKGINGDGGGSYAPTRPIVMGGFNAFNLTTAASQLEGGISTATGGRVQLDASGGNNQPVLVAPLGDTIVVPCLELLSPLADLVGGGGFSYLQDDDVNLTDAPGFFGSQTVLSVNNATFIPLSSRYLHQGASWSKLRLHFRVPTKPASNAALPAIAFAPFIWNPATQSFGNFAPNFAVWVSGATYAVGNYVIPVAAHTNGYYYKCTGISTGIAGSNPAVFDGQTTIGGPPFADGGVSWTCTGKSGQLPQVGLDAATYYNNGLPQVLEFDFDNPDPAHLATNAIDHTTYAYGFFIGGEGDAGQGVVAAVNALVHTIEIVLTNIVDLRFE